MATRKVRRVGYRIYKTSLVKKMKMTQSLIITIDTNIDFTINDNVDRCKIIVSTAMMFERGIRYPTVCLGYVIVALATLSVGLWSGGWPFFRFDEQERVRSKIFSMILYPRATT